MKTSLRARDFSKIVESGSQDKTMFSHASGTPPKQATPSKKEIVKHKIALQIYQNVVVKDTNFSKNSSCKFIRTSLGYLAQRVTRKYDQDHQTQNLKR